MFWLQEYLKNGAILPETLFEKGAYLGLGIDTRSGKGVASPGLCDGVIPASEDFSGYIEFTLISDNVSCQVDRTLSTDGINYSKVVDVNRGDIDKNGYNTGLYGSGASARIEYKVRINAEKGNSLLSRSFVDHDAGEIADGDIINVR